VIPNDPVGLYLEYGYGASWLKAYFNPANFFDEVYSLSPYERVDGDLVGLIPIATPRERLHYRIRELVIDVVRAYGGWHPCEIACADKVSGVPVVVSVHDTSPELVHDSIREADVVLYVSEQVKRVVSAKYDRTDRLWSLPNRVDFDVIRPRDRSEMADLDQKYRFRYRIFHVGRKTEAKNLDNLIRALRLLGPDYCLLATGKGDPEPFRRIAEQEGVLDRCFLIESIPNEELPRYFSWADCMCNPSRWEGMSLALIEALAGGAVLVTSDKPEISQFVQHEENGLLIRDYLNPAAIAAAIQRACTDQDLRRTIKANARASVEKFERSRIDALEASYYETVLAMRDRGEFSVPLATRASRGIERNVRRIVPKSLKAAIRPILEATGISKAK